MAKIDLLSIDENGYAVIRFDLYVEGELTEFVQNVILPLDEKEREKKLVEYVTDYQNSLLPPEEAKTQSFVVTLEKKDKSLFKRILGK